MAYSIGVDTGGTFTDGVLVSDDGDLTTFKTPTTPRDYVQGISACVAGLAGTRGLSMTDLLNDTKVFIHGTTVATNTMITLDGARVGLITSWGHEDALHIGQGRFSTVAGLDRSALDYPARIDNPPPLVERGLTIGVRGRIDSMGRVVVPLHEDDVRAAVSRLDAAGVTSFAVALLWSFRNPTLERRIGEIIAEVHPGASITLSCDLLPRLGEYVRTSSTVINSFCIPVMSGYLRRLGGSMKAAGLEREPLIMSSSGGCVPIETAATKPLVVLQSGPVGGIAGSAVLGGLSDESNIICTDMGGTSFDVGLVYKSRPLIARESVISRYPYGLTLVDVESIGAGGGSLAEVDAQGAVQVGPRSAGAEPGPACYGRGGQLPTVTDADLVLGYVSDSAFLGGRMKLDKAASERVIKEHVADPLGLSIEDAAFGMHTLINAQMADFIRMKSIRAGYDPREFIIYAYGGAGPVHASGYSRDLGVSKVVIPLGDTSSVFSAFGLTVTDVNRVWEFSRPMREPFEWSAIEIAFDELKASATGAFAADGFDVDTLHYERLVAMKYVGQIHEVDVVVPGAAFDHRSGKELTAAFDTTYDRIFGPGAGLREAGAEIIDFKLKATHELTRSPQVGTSMDVGADPSAERQAEAETERRVYWRELGGFAPTPVLRSRDLEPGRRFEGPLIIELPNTSVPIQPGDVVSLDGTGSLVIELASARS